MKGWGGGVVTVQVIVSNKGNYSTTINFGVLPLVEIDHVTQYCLSSAAAYQCDSARFGNFRSKLSVLQ